MHYKNKGFLHYWSIIDRSNLLVIYNYLNQNDKQNNDLHCGADVLFQYQKHCICDHNVFPKVVLKNAHTYAMIETASRTILLEPAKDLL